MKRFNKKDFLYVSPKTTKYLLVFFLIMVVCLILVPKPSRKIYLTYNGMYAGDVKKFTDCSTDPTIRCVVSSRDMEFPLRDVLLK